MGVRKLIAQVSSVVPRNYVVVEVKSNLLAAERKETLKRFVSPCYKKIAHVVMGEPEKDFKARTHSHILKLKQTKADDEWRVKKAERVKHLEAKKAQKEREETIRQRQKEDEERRKS